MGLFKNWVKLNFDKPTLNSANNPDAVYVFWEAYQASKWDQFEQYKAYGSVSTADIDPDARLTAAKQNPNALAGAGALLNELDAYSDYIENCANLQQNREKAKKSQEKLELQAHRTKLEEVDEEVKPTGTSAKGKVGTVRLQVQNNFKTKEKDEVCFARVVDSADGVSVASLDAAFELLVTDTGWTQKKLVEKLRESYAKHTEAWSGYVVGNSYSVNFDTETIKVGGRPKSGYRLDVENLREAPGKRNFI